MNAVLRRYPDLVACLALLLTFALAPRIDLAVAAWFYEPGAGFPALRVPWIRAVYRIVAVAWVLVPIIVGLLLLSWLPALRPAWSARRRPLAYLLAALVIGPGLISHSVFKDNWGRPRPVHLARFGGAPQATFTPVLTPGTQCHRNCSFVSGHAAVATLPVAGYWMTRRKRWLAVGFTGGLLVGGLRMAMGAHFLSDVLFAMLIVHFTCRVLAWLFGLAAPGALRSGAGDDEGDYPRSGPEPRMKNFSKQAHRPEPGDSGHAMKKGR